MSRASNYYFELEDGLFFDIRHWGQNIYTSFDHDCLKSEHQKILLNNTSEYVPLPVFTSKDSKVLISPGHGNGNFRPTATVATNLRNRFFSYYSAGSSNLRFTISSYSLFIHGNAPFENWHVCFMMVIRKDYYHQINDEWQNCETVEQANFFIKKYSHMFEFWVNQNMRRENNIISGTLKKFVIPKVVFENIRVSYKTTQEIYEKITPYGTGPFSNIKEMKSMKRNLGYNAISQLNF